MGWETWVMGAQTYEDILHEAEKLPPDQRLLLAEHLIHGAHPTASVRPGPVEGRTPSPAWEEYGGSAPYPLCGEDAQEWVGRARSDRDEATTPR